MVTKKTPLQEQVRTLEESIITISGPALATSGIIAGIDILTNNIIARYAPAVGTIAAVMWAICLMISLDFQVLVLGVRAHRIYTSREKHQAQKIFEIVLTFLIAGALGYVSLQMGSIFAKMIGTTLSIDEAAKGLGINPIALIYERSAMVMLLIFMSGWLRDTDSKQEQDTTPPQTQGLSTLKQEDIQAVLSALGEVQALRQQLATLPVQITEVQPAQAQLPEQAASKDDTCMQVSAETPPLDPLLDNAVGLQPSSDYGEKIEALYKDNPEITAGEAAKLAGCSRTTAAKWLERVRPLGREEKEEE